MIALQTAAQGTMGFPGLIAGAGERADGAFLLWCAGKEIDELGRVQQAHVAAYIEQLQGDLRISSW